jgi:hypothetical protein
MLCLQVMGYGITHKLFGFVWKGQMRILYPSTAAYATVMGDVASFTGACTIALMLVSKYIFQVQLSWQQRWHSGSDTALVMLARSGCHDHLQMQPVTHMPLSNI